MVTPQETLITSPSPNGVSFVGLLTQFKEDLDNKIGSGGIGTIAKEIDHYIGSYKIHIDTFTSSYAHLNSEDRIESSNILLNSLFDLIDLPWSSNELTDTQIKDLTQFVVTGMTKVVFMVRDENIQYIESEFLDYLWRLVTVGESRFNNRNWFEITDDEFAKRMENTREVVKDTLKELKQSGHEILDKEKYDRIFLT